MIEIEVIGTEAAITAAKAGISPLATASVRAFHHQGASGDAGIYGLLTSVLSAAIPKLVEILKPLIRNDRDLKISFNGFELMVRDIKEATDVVDLLAARGILQKVGQMK
jgi:hypothetical protein